VFALSGNHVMPVFDAALDAGLDLVHVRHEAATVHMADGYARVTGEVGIALVTGGPGHANAISALYTALAAQSPVVLLSGHAPHQELGRGAFQEMRQADMAAPVTKASWTVGSADDIADALARAMRIARSGWPGPVHLSLPTDVLEAATQASVPAPDAFAPEVERGDIAQAAIDALSRAQRPVIVVGPALTAFTAHALPRDLADTTGVPVAVMESPRGIHDASLGAFAEMLAQADVVALIGKRRDFTLRFGAAFPPECEVIEWEDQISPIAIVQQLIARAGGQRTRHHAWRSEVEDALRYRPPAWQSTRSAPEGPMHPLTICTELQAALDAHRGSILVADGGEFCQWVQGAVNAPRRLINGPAGAIGPALPMALGAKLARPDALVVATVGDGTFGFHASELDTAVRCGLPVVTVIGNDARWNAEYQIQRRAYGEARAHGCELLPSRYEGVAEALGAYGERVSRPDELAPALQRAIAAGRPACLNVALDGIAAPRISRT